MDTNELIEMMVQENPEVRKTLLEISTGLKAITKGLDSSTLHRKTGVPKVVQANKCMQGENTGKPGPCPGGGTHHNSEKLNTQQEGDDSQQDAAQTENPYGEPDKRVPKWLVSKLEWLQSKLDYLEDLFDFRLLPKDRKPRKSLIHRTVIRKELVGMLLSKPITKGLDKSTLYKTLQIRKCREGENAGLPGPCPDPNSAYKPSPWGPKRFARESGQKVEPAEKEKIINAVGSLGKENYGLVSIADLGRKLKLKPEVLHNIINILRRERVLTASAFEGRHGIKQEDEQYLMDDGDNTHKLGYVSLRKD